MCRYDFWGETVNYTHMFMLFIDLRKMYDSVPREALWSALERYGKMTVTELQFADDLAAVSTTRVKVEESASILNSILREWGLTMSMAKTKLLVVGSSEEEDLRPLKLDGGEVEYVTKFRYLCIESLGVIHAHTHEIINLVFKNYI